MAGFISDFARRPRGFKVATFAAIAGVLGLVYWQLAYEPLQADIAKAKSDRVLELDDKKDLRKQKSELAELITRRGKLASKIEQNQKALPTEAEMPAFFDMLSRKIAEAGVEAVKRELKKEVTLDPSAGSTPAKPANAAQAKAAVAAAAAAASANAPRTVFLKVPVEIEISGNFYQLKRFFASLRPHPPDRDGGDDGVEKDRLVTIENLALSEPKVKNSEIVLTARFTASTFRAVTENAPPPTPTPTPTPGAATPPPPAGTGAGPGAGTGSAFNRTLDAPANTPARAKAQTEAAAGAAEGRTRAVPDPDEPEGGL